MQNPQNPMENQDVGETTDVNTAPPAPAPDVDARLAEMSDAYLRAKAEGETIRRRAEEEVS